MVDLVSLIVGTTVIGSLYAMTAIGLTLIFGVGGVFNLAHGAILSLGAFTAYFISNPSQGGMSIWLGILGGTLAAGAFGGIFYVGLIEEIEENPVAVLLVTILTAFTIQWLFGSFITRVKFSVPQPVGGGVQVMGVNLQNLSILIFAIVWAFILGLSLFVNRTNVGRAILAMSMNQKGVTLIGADPRQLKIYTWVVASAAAGLAGVFLAAYRTGAWDMGLQPLMLSFAIVIVGGLGSIKGSVVAAYGIAFAEVLTTSVLNPKLTGVVPLLLMVLVLLIRPEGLYGRGVTDSG